MDFNKRVKKTNNIIFDMDMEDVVLRDIQVTALNWFKKVVETGKKFMTMELPTGSGKSILSLSAVNHYFKNVDAEAKVDFITATKNLQEQYTNEFSYITNLWGKSNYECHQYNTDCEKGKLICKASDKPACESCPHSEAQSRWLDGKLSLTNFHSLSLYSIFLPEMIKARSADVLVVDEAHLLEDVFNNYLSFKISKKLFLKLFDDSKHVENLVNDLVEFRNIKDIVDWIDNVFMMKLSIAEGKIKTAMKVGSSRNRQTAIKSMNDLLEIRNKMERFSFNYRNNIEYVAEKSYFKGDIYWDVTPLWCGETMFKTLFSKYKRVIFMSATILDSNLFSFLNGLNPNDNDYISLPSPFDLKNRPFYYYPVGKMTYNTKKSVWSNYIVVVKKIMKKYEGKKGIIHCNSYELFEWLKRDIKDNRLIFATPTTRQESINEHMNRKDDCILVSPSMTEGVDLKDDYSRFQIILKVPYPSLASEKYKKRLKQNPTWYNVKTAQTIMQTYGRSVRSEDDHADTFMLDESFGGFLSRSGSLFPKYFVDAIIKIKK